MLKCGLNVYTFCKFNCLPPLPVILILICSMNIFDATPPKKLFWLIGGMGKVDGLCTNLDALRNLSVGSLQNYLHALKYAEIIIAATVNILFGIWYFIWYLRLFIFYCQLGCIKPQDGGHMWGTTSPWNEYMHKFYTYIFQNLWSFLIFSEISFLIFLWNKNKDDQIH